MPPIQGIAPAQHSATTRKWIFLNRRDVRAVVAVGQGKILGALPPNRHAMRRVAEGRAPAAKISPENF